MAQTAGAATQALPNGANAINEQYGQWAVRCGTQKGAKICMIGQQRSSAEGQSVMSISLHDTGSNSSMAAVVMLPFGVLVSKPVIFQLDNTRTKVNANVRTCLPQGCMVSVTFDRAIITAMRTGKVLNVIPRSAGPKEEEVKNLSFDLKGFSAALERLEALNK